MNYLQQYLSIFVFIAFCISCQNGSKEIADSSELELNGTKDEISNTSSNDPIQRIKENFNRINSIKNWTKIDKKELQESTEGGEVRYYILEGQLEKIVTQKFGEMFQQTTEYYLLNNQISFVFEKSLLYNRPMYYDQAEMEANGDSEYFDIDKSKSIETRIYFDQNKIIQVLSNQNQEAIIEEEELEKLLLKNYQSLIELQNS